MPNPYPIDWVVLSVGLGMWAALWIGATVLGRFQAKTTLPDPVETTLMLCTGCGHRHRLAWMRWTADGHYHCNACCADPVT